MTCWQEWFQDRDKHGSGLVDEHSAIVLNKWLSDNKYPTQEFRVVAK